MAPAARDKWMGFACSGEVMEGTKDAYGAFTVKVPPHHSDMLPFTDGKGRKWMSLTSPYDPETWGGLVENVRVGVATLDNHWDKRQAVSDFPHIYPPELYQNVAHLGYNKSTVKATWRINSGPGEFQLLLHMFELTREYERVFSVAFVSGGCRKEALVRNKERDDSRVHIQVFNVSVKPPNTSFDFEIATADRNVKGERWPSFSAFEVRPKEDAAAQAARQFPLVVGKLVAGFVRFFFEDVFNSFCQGVYLCKVWHSDEVSISAKAFACMSILAGVGCSLAGPLFECVRTRRLRANMSSSGAGLGSQLDAGLVTEQVPLLQKARPPQGNGADDARVAAKGGAQVAAKASADEETAGRDGVVEEAEMEELIDLPEKIYTVSIGDIVRRPFNHKALLSCSAIFWATMASVYFTTDVECGGNPPQVAWLMFFSATTLSLLLEIWLAIQSKRGYVMFRDLHPKLWMTMALGRLGHFDTFSDVLSSKIMESCVRADVDNFTWFSAGGHIFHLPTDLSTMMKFGLLMIVVLQVIPGLVLLLTRRQLSIALKTSEFTMLLCIWEAE